MRPRAVLSPLLITLISAIPADRLRETVMRLVLDGAGTGAPIPAETAPESPRAAKRRRRPRSDRGLKRGPRKAAVNAMADPADPTPYAKLRARFVRFAHLTVANSIEAVWQNIDVSVIAVRRKKGPGN
jgi:hypothetical protein